MDSTRRKQQLPALLSSLISQLLLLLLLLFSSSTPLSLDSSNSNHTFSSLIHRFLSSQEIAAVFSQFAVSRKRKRTHFLDLNSDPGDEISPGSVGHSPLRSPDSFRNSFKMTSETFEWLAGSLEPLLDCRDPVGSPLNLSAELRLAIGLFRLATGSDYQTISTQFGVSEWVARFCAKQLCRVLCTDFRFWVNFLNPNELESVSSALNEKTGFPNCCGVIDCARFKIVRGNGIKEQNDNSSEETIAAQILVDSSSRILSIVAGFRGNKSDSKVLKLSTLHKDIEEGNLLNSPPVYLNGVAIEQFLIGDKGYPLLPWLMVPFEDAIPGSSEEHFNKSHHRIRVSALQTIASLKNWGVLSQPIEEEAKTAVAYIGACSILHNALLMREDYSALVGDFEGHSFIDQSCSHSHGDTSFVDTSIELKASVIRRALATRAKEFHDSKHHSMVTGFLSLEST
uniref:DDE Tnp4 domain-containing protein n=1 Tax=Cannabis sativa TaxID=3483 RepID=A0A803NLV4_CANSA